MKDEWLEWLGRICNPRSRLEIVLRGYTRCNANYYIAPRQLPEHLIYQLVEHDIHVSFADSEHIVEAGQLLWVPPGTQHSFRPAIKNTRVLVYHHRFYLADDCPDSPPVILPLSAHRRERFADLHDGSEDNNPLWRLRYRASLLSTFAEIAETSEKKSQDASVFNPQQRRHIMQAVHHDSWTDPERLALLLGYHPAYFARIFKRSFGSAPRSWILQQRMQHAGVLLLESSDAIHAVAEELGYNDPFLFSRQFKQVHSISPRDWRHRHSAPRQL